MSLNRGGKVALMIVAAIFFAGLLTAVVMYLWNWLMPELFGITTITFWQALGILILSKILFGGWMHKKHCGHCHGNGKWGKMSSEDKFSMKQKFMQKWAECDHSRTSSLDEETDN